MAQLGNPAPRYANDNFDPLSGGKLYFYEVGTTTPKPTYSDNALTIPNANPVILSSGGLQPNVFLDGGYRVILKDKNDIQVWDRDNVAGGFQAFLDVVQVWTASQNFDQATLVSSGNAVAWDAAIAQVAQHDMTQNTTVGAPSNLKAGMYISINVIQGVGAYTLAWNAVFKGSIPIMPSDNDHQCLFVFYSPDGINCHYTGGSGEIPN